MSVGFFPENKPNGVCNRNRRIQFTLLSQRSMTNVCQKALPLGLLKGRKEGRKEGDPHDSRGFLVIKIGICDDFLRLKLLKKSGLDFFNR
jgi:hypothetical protein